MTRIIVTALAAATLSAPAAAQQPAPRVDRIGHIVAVVGDSAILNFDIQDGVLALAAQSGQTLTPGTPQYQDAAEQVLDLRITELLILQAAQRDTTIQVSPEQVNRLVQAKVDEDAQRVGGMPQLEQALSSAGLTLQAYRERLARQFTKQGMIEQYRNRAAQSRRTPPISDSDLRPMFEQYRDQIGVRPATVTLERIIVPARASEEEYAAARVRADSVFKLIQTGEDFASLARRFGEDDTRDRGGELGWYRRSDLTRAFADVAFSLAPGNISAPVRTEYGYHLINVQRVRGAEIQVRHILFQADVGEDDIARAKAQADTVAARLRAGASATQLWTQYGNQDLAVRVGPTELSPFQQQFGIDLSTANVGEVIGPLPSGAGGAAADFTVMRIVEREPERQWTFEDEALRQQLRQQAGYAQLMDEIVADLRRSTYVEIRGF